MNQKAILKGVEKLHAQAKKIGTGTVKVGKVTFKLIFNGHGWVATGPNGEEHAWNTRQISVAKKWTKEYYEN